MGETRGGEGGIARKRNKNIIPTSDPTGRRSEFSIPLSAVPNEPPRRCVNVRATLGDSAT